MLARLCQGITLTLFVHAGTPHPHVVAAQPRVQDASGALRAALDDERAALEELHALHGQAVEDVAGVAADLERLGRALDAGRWAAALAPFDRAYRALHQARYVREHLKDNGSGPERFEQVWEEALGELATLAPRGATSDRGPELVAVFQDAATLRAWRTLAAARAQAREVGVRAGYYYTGEALASARLAQTLRALPGREAPLPSASPALPAALLERLEADLAQRFRPPFAQDAHAHLIEWSACLEFARELAGQGAHASALWQGLETLRAVEDFLGGEAAAGPSPETLAAAARRLETAHGDGSIGAAILQAARCAAEDGERPGARRDALTLVGPVLDAYLASLEARTPSTPPSARVRVTLVRWPFT